MTTNRTAPSLARVMTELILMLVVLTALLVSTGGHQDVSSYCTAEVDGVTYEVPTSDPCGSFHPVPADVVALGWTAVVPPCPEEDSPGPCVWHAETRGNGSGDSFVVDSAQHVHYTN